MLPQQVLKDLLAPSFPLHGDGMTQGTTTNTLSIPGYLPIPYWQLTNSSHNIMIPFTPIFRKAEMIFLISLMRHYGMYDGCLPCRILMTVECIIKQPMQILM